MSAPGASLDVLGANLGTLRPYLGALRAHLGALRPHLGALGANLEAFGCTWGALRAQLGRSWDQLGANLGAPGTNLAPTWALLEPSWDQLEPTLGYHGRSCNALGALLVTLGRLWTLQGRSRVDFDAPRRILAFQRQDFDVYEALFWSVWRSFLICNQRIRELSDNPPRRFRKPNPAAMYSELPTRSLSPR